MNRLARFILPAALAAAFGLSAHAALARTLVLVRGSGWGNGVGMSQWGAEGFALHGAGYRPILAHYYPHTTIADVPDRTVRVLLAERLSRATIASRAPFLLVDAAGRRVHVRAGSVRLTPALTVYGRRLAAPVRVEPGAAVLALDGKGYRGTFTVARSAGSLAVVDALPLERYLRGVVPSEMPLGWMPQAYEAQAVAARSYALAILEPGGSFDLYADNRSQVYGGISVETPATNAAVADTAGEVLTYDGRIITAYYDSNSGGAPPPWRTSSPATRRSRTSSRSPIPTTQTRRSTAGSCR